MKTIKTKVRARPKRLSVCAPAAVKKNVEYNKDFFSWANTQADLLKKGKLDKLDVKNLIEEIESLGKRERGALRSHISNWLMHKLKVTYQPNKRTRSWDKSMANASIEIEWALNDSPSLNHCIEEILREAYKAARLKAASETGLDIEVFPKECPWKMEDILF